MINYSRKTALVTGASSGIGEIFAQELARKGSNLILVARSKEKLQALAKQLTSEFNVKVDVILVDLAIEHAAQTLAEEIERLNIPVDILINNAGFATHGFFDEVSGSRQHEEVMLNVTTLVDLTHLFLTPMVKKKDGIIINVASTAAFQPDPYMAVYGATKAFVLSFTEAIWTENRKRGVKILALCPGSTDTAFFDVVGANEASVGKRTTPLKVVQTAFKALEKEHSSVIVGDQNYLLAQVSRFLPRKVVLRIVERTLRPQNATLSVNSSSSSNK